MLANYQAVATLLSSSGRLYRNTVASLKPPPQEFLPNTFKTFDNLYAGIPAPDPTTDNKERK